MHREWCEQAFEPYLRHLSGSDHRRRLAQFVAICDVYTWKLLRRDYRLSRFQMGASDHRDAGPIHHGGELMSTILAYTSPAIGHLFPLTPLLLELQHRGHTIHLRTLSSRVDDMRRLGFQVEPIDPEIERIVHVDFKAKSAKGSLTASSAVFNKRGVLDAEDFRRTKDQVRPDLAIVDVNCWGAAFTAEALGDPWLSFAAYTPPLSSPGTPPFGPGLAPMGGPLGRIRDAIVKKAVLGAVEKAMLPSVNSLRSGLGLAAATSADDLYRKAPLMLVATSKPFEYATTEWGPNVVMIGASAWEPPSSPT